MAKIAFESNKINDVFDGDISVAISANHHKATYTDDTTDGSLVFIGTNLQKQADSVLLSGGRVEKLVIYDKNGDFAGVLTDADVKAKNLSTAFAEDNMTGLLAVLLGGKDSIIGSADGDTLLGFGRADVIRGGKGQDFFAGGKSNDILTGGQHSDTFYFAPPSDGKGHDTITDFDVTGDIVDFLTVDGDEIASITRANRNQDTLLTLGDGSTILLEDVTRAEFLAYQDTLV